MLIINPGELNLQTIAGTATLILGESDLPNDLYVVGVGNMDYDYYLDPMIYRAKELSTFLQRKGFNVAVGLPYNGGNRPALAISRRTRENNINGATDFCILVMLFINNRLNIDS